MEEQLCNSKIAVFSFLKTLRGLINNPPYPTKPMEVLPRTRYPHNVAFSSGASLPTSQMLNQVSVLDIMIHIGQKGKHMEMFVLFIYVFFCQPTIYNIKHY